MYCRIVMTEVPVMICPIKHGHNQHIMAVILVYYVVGGTDLEV